MIMNYEHVFVGKIKQYGFVYILATNRGTIVYAHISSYV